MNRICKNITTARFMLIISAAIAFGSSAAQAATEAPIKEIISAHVGWEVDHATGGNICTVESKEQCKFATQSGEPGGFRFAEGVAVNNASALVSSEHGDAYVADFGNHRVQVLSPSGEFVLMFGWNVDKTKQEEGAPEAERNVCTAASKDTCQAGTPGTGAGQFTSPASLIVSPDTGNVYVEDTFNWRVLEFTADGEFILMLGKKVNESNGSNICTAASKDKCTVGERAENGTETGAFDFPQQRGELLTIGGPEDNLYIGDRHRVQIFKAGGTPAGEISLTSISSESISEIQAIAVDQTGNVYVAYSVKLVENEIYELGPEGNEIKRYELRPRQADAPVVEVALGAMAFDLTGRLAVSERETGFKEGSDFRVLRGGLYEVEATSLRLLTEFNSEFQRGSTSQSALSIDFDNEDHMYAVGDDELALYLPVPVGELSLIPTSCEPGADSETDATFDCDLSGEANPWGVPGTTVWFEWGDTLNLGHRTEPQPVKTAVVSLEAKSMLKDLLPNETYYYLLAGEDENVKTPELLTSEISSFVTPAVVPRIVGAPRVIHVGPFAVVLFGELNPENAPTTYTFQYWRCEESENCSVCEETKSCAEFSETDLAQSPIYGPIGATVEATGLLPDTRYRYRLLAKSQGGEARSEPFGEFTTAPGPAVVAHTGEATIIGSTSALVSGTVNPDGQAATYSFELGLYKGDSTQFGIVFSAPAGSGTVDIEKTLDLLGLQPATTYAYRIALHSGDGSAKGERATGATHTFTTIPGPSTGIRSNRPPQLVVPSIPFPKSEVGKPVPTKAQKLANAIKACRHKRGRQRASCEKKARVKYSVKRSSKS